MVSSGTWQFACVLLLLCQDNLDSCIELGENGLNQFLGGIRDASSSSMCKLESEEHHFLAWRLFKQLLQSRSVSKLPSFHNSHNGSLANEVIKKGSFTHDLHFLLQPYHLICNEILSPVEVKTKEGKKSVYPIVCLCPLIITHSHLRHLLEKTGSRISLNSIVVF